MENVAENQTVQSNCDSQHGLTLNIIMHISHCRCDEIISCVIKFKDQERKNSITTIMLWL